MATVSRVLSGVRPDNDEIAARVRTAAADLDFRPNPSAQGMRRPVSAVGVIVPDLANPYFAELLKGISAAAENSGRRMLVADAAENPLEEARLIRELTRWSSGLILCSPRMPARQLADVCGAIDRPLVTINRHTSGRPGVTVDFTAGIRALCAHLRDLGHEHIAYVKGPALSWSDGERRRALRAEQKRGLRVDFFDGGPGITDGHSATDAALETGATAVVAFSDYVALGILIRATEIGVRVPEDVSVTGFDDIPVSRIAGPGLTTATVNKIDLGCRAFELLGETPSDRRVTMKPTLVIRGSTGRARRRS